MGTHPIFESDFDCLTECPREIREQTPKEIPGTLRVMAAIFITTTAMGRTIRLRGLMSITVLLETRVAGTATTIPVKHRPASTTGTLTPAGIAECGGSRRISSKFNTSLLL